MSPLLQKIGIELPIIQAPMAGVSTPELAAAVSNAGALGSIAVGSVDCRTARQMIEAVRAKTDRPFNVNVFCHRPAVANAAREAAWLARLAPEFARFGVSPPLRLQETYTSFLIDDEKLTLLVAERPAVVSFHFGLPRPAHIEQLHQSGILLLATATNLNEAQAVAAAGIDAVIAQGIEAGGHRGRFDPDEPDEQLRTRELTQLLVQNVTIPVIAAGGIMDGGDIRTVLDLGATAAQLGTAFIVCPESAAEQAHREKLLSPAAAHTVLTRVLSGRPARCLSNRFTGLGADILPEQIPAYPLAYDAAKALHAAARSAGEYGYGPQWAGQGAVRARALPAAELIAQLRNEMAMA